METSNIMLLNVPNDIITKCLVTSAKIYKLNYNFITLIFLMLFILVVEENVYVIQPCYI